MPNRGIAPATPGTEIYKFRQKSNDLMYVALDPPEAGYGDYRFNSDVEVEGWLEQGAGSLYNSLGFFYLALAAEAAVESAMIKDHDLTRDNTKRYNAIMEMAQKWFDLGAEEDVITGATDIFEVHGPPTQYGCACPEAAPCVRCRGVYVF